MVKIVVVEVVVKDEVAHEFQGVVEVGFEFEIVFKVGFDEVVLFES